MYEPPRFRVLPIHVDAAVLAVRRCQDKAGSAEAWVSLGDAHGVYRRLPLGGVAHVGRRQFISAVRAAEVDGRLERRVVSYGRGGVRTNVRVAQEGELRRRKS